MGVDAETRSSDVKMEIKDLYQIKNEDRFKSIQIILKCVRVDGK